MNQESIEAAVFRRLLSHLDGRKDVQNIDLMTLSGFCRNCLSRWYMEEAQEQGLSLDKDQAREIIYGMPYDDWKKHIKQRLQHSKDKLLKPRIKTKIRE